MEGCGLFRDVVEDDGWGSLLLPLDPLGLLYRTDVVGSDCCLDV